ncbi:unannotated protein [freshwater metagenome]|uniref:Unannotated protein n=1 Tax=freshwater metagenome TaxID=449393 RepID=A0A6J7G6D8_9ZZZZ
MRAYVDRGEAILADPALDATAKTKALEEILRAIRFGFADGDYHFRDVYIRRKAESKMGARSNVIPSDDGE